MVLSIDSWPIVSDTKQVVTVAVFAKNFNQSLFAFVIVFNRVPNQIQKHLFQRDSNRPARWQRVSATVPKLHRGC